jgi:putative acetyltransferase
MNIRSERPEDSVAIREILVAAFPSDAEADLVERLRRDGDLALALVADDGGRLHGYAAFAKLLIADGERIHRAVGLAPIAVTPLRQRLGIGGALIREAHSLLAARGIPLVFVLGDPNYYTRQGYDPDLALPFDCAHAGPYFMALRLNDSAPKAGKVRYPAAFDQLG